MGAIAVSTDFIKKLKQQILASRYVVAKLANAEMLRLYFSIGKMVEDEIEENKWGSKIINEISSRLQTELPGVRGFLGKNIEKMRRFYKTWNPVQEISSSLTSKFENDKILVSSSLASKLGNNDFSTFLSVSFTHHYEIILKTKTEEERWYYINNVA